tara:strand:+ start:8619 stop:10883 length:2265 start_codon:yes stop_codon:yes gene_type:complete
MNPEDFLKAYQQAVESDPQDVLPDPAAAEAAAKKGGNIWDKLEEMAAVVTGRGRREEDVPEMTERDLWEAGGGDPNALMYGMPWQDSSVSATDAGKFTAGRYLTEDDTQMRAILENAVGKENVQFYSDRFNNTVVALGGKPFYLNKPGFSMADLQRLAGQLGSYAPASRMFQMGSSIGRAIKTGLGIGATSAARESASWGLGGGPESGPIPDGNRVLLTAALGALSVPAGDLAGKAGRKAWGALQKWFNKGDLTDDAIRALREAGVYSEDLTPQLRALYRDLESKYGQAVAVSRTADALTPEGLRTPLTKGDITQDAAAQQAEYRAEAGLSGETAQMIARGGRASQSEAVQGAPDVLHSAVGTGVAQARGTPGEIIQQRLQSMAATDKAAYRYAYDVAETTSTALPPNGRQALLDDVQAVTRTGMHERVDEFQRARDSLTKILEKENPTITELNYWRRDLGAVAEKAEGEAKLHLNKMKSNFDEHIDELILQGLLIGDAQGAQWWKTAVKLRSDYGKNWGARHKSDPNFVASQLVTEDGRMTVLPEEAANFILGGANTEFFTKPALHRGLSVVRDRLGADNPEWLGIVDEVTLRMLSTATNKAGEFVPSTFMKNWMTLKDRNTGLLNLMYTLDEQKMISRWIFNASKAGKVKPTGRNTSNTAAFFKGLPIVRHLRNVGAPRQAASSFSGRLPTNIVPQVNVAAALAAPQAAVPLDQRYPNLGAGAPAAVGEGLGFLRNSVTGLLGGNNQGGPIQ